MPLIATILIFCSVLLGSDDPAGNVATGSRPNIILMLSDDQSWNGLSVRMHPTTIGSASEVIETPSLEKMAANGLRFSTAYAPASVCSPTRISLQTGRSVAALGWTKAGPPVNAAQNYPMIGAPSRRSITAGETTIGEVLQSAGYTTAHLGKWHLEGGGPGKHGYDVHDGNWGNEAAVKFKDPNPVDLFGMAERSIDFMKKQQTEKKPFFLQLSWLALHQPQNALAETVEKYKGKMRGGRERQAQRAALAENMDTAVGRILTAVDELGLSGNTYVIYMSDNGGNSRTSLLGGGKGNLREGGIRVPFILQGPGIPANSWSDTQIVGFDLFPTFCEWAHVPKEQMPKELEGGSLVPHLKSLAEIEAVRKKNASTDTRKKTTLPPLAPVERPREELVFHFPHYQTGDPPHSVIYHDGYKLFQFHDSGNTELYAITKDLAETKNLAPQMKEKVEALTLKLGTYLEIIEAKMPTKNPQYDPQKPSTERKRRDRSNPRPRRERG